MFFVQFSLVKALTPARCGMVARGDITSTCILAILHLVSQAGLTHGGRDIINVDDDATLQLEADAVDAHVHTQAENARLEKLRYVLRGQTVGVRALGKEPKPKTCAGLDRKACKKEVGCFEWDNTFENPWRCSACMPPNELNKQFYPEWQFIFSVGDWNELAARQETRVQHDVEAAGLEFLGEGGFGCVYRVKFIKVDSKLNYAMESMVMKFTKPSYNGHSVDKLDTYERTNAEAQALGAIQNSPGFVKAFDWKVYTEWAPAILMEEGGQSLFEIVYEDRNAGGNEAFIARCFRDIVEGVVTLMEAGYVHKDLKPENIVWRDRQGGTEKGYAKIIDYDMATTEGASSDYGGTRNYMPPEYTEEDPDPKGNDIWALGVLLYELVFSTTILDKAKTGLSCIEQLHNKSSDCFWGSMCQNEMTLPWDKHRSHSAISEACTFFPSLFNEDVVERLAAFNNGKNSVVEKARAWEDHSTVTKRPTQQDFQSQKTSMIDSFQELLKKQLPKLKADTKVSVGETGESCSQWCANIMSSTTTCQAPTCHCKKGHLPAGPPHQRDLNSAKKVVLCKKVGPEYNCKFALSSACDSAARELLNLQFLPELSD